MNYVFNRAEIPNLDFCNQISCFSIELQLASERQGKAREGKDLNPSRTDLNPQRMLVHTILFPSGGGGGVGGSHPTSMIPPRYEHTDLNP